MLRREDAHDAIADRRAEERRLVTLTIDGDDGRASRRASTILDACRALGIDTPTLCYGDTLHPVNVCRVCVVEVEGARVLVPACSRKVEAGMVVQTDSERVRTAASWCSSCSARRSISRPRRASP